jgi:hypothetical protein
MIQGDVKEIIPGDADEYATRVSMVLPLSPSEVQMGDYGIEYEGKTIDIRLEVIFGAENDPIISAGKDFRIGDLNVPFYVFSDNRGNYPCLLATLVFPYRLANWSDSQHESGIRMDDNYEEVQVIGPPIVTDKVKSLVVLNRLLKTGIVQSEFKPLSYESVTAMLWMYFKKPEQNPSLVNLMMLASNTAYRDALEYYFLPGFDQKQLSQAIVELSDNVKQKAIANENDLLKIVNSVFDGILRHHIEDRQWIEAFWDSERETTIDNKVVSIPKTPKGERGIQPTLHVILDIALSPIGIQVVRESDEGVGSLDFRCLYTTRENLGISVGIEFKLAHHPRIHKGIRKQLPSYLKAIKSSSGIFAIMWFKDDEGKVFSKPSEWTRKDDMVTWLKKEAQKVSQNENTQIIVAMIDASVRPSASK